jgi:hypothetical protein
MVEEVVSVYLNIAQDETKSFEIALIFNKFICNIRACGL